MKTLSGYFGGYISKKHKIGRFELRNSVEALPLLSQKLREKNYRRGGAHLAHVANRMFTTLESKGILRTAPEEFSGVNENKYINTCERWVEINE